MSLPKHNPLDSLFSPEQAAERLGVSLATVWRLVRRGKIAPTYKLGHRTTRIPAAALARYLEECKV